MSKIIFSASAIVLSLIAAPQIALAQSTGQSGDLSISSTVNGSTLEVTASGSQFAGAISSLQYRGVEYVDIADHGRQIQTAFSFDNLGECYNPTEAGTARDGASLTSSSKLLSLTNSGNVLRSSNQPAFWLAPGTDYKRACGLTKFTTAQNATVLSNYGILRTTSFYGPSIPNLLNVNVGIKLTENRSSASIEALTGYLPPAFSMFLGLNRSNMVLSRLDPTQSAGKPLMRNPVIISTPDGLHAMGVISPEIEAPANTMPAYYAYFQWPNLVSKWSCVFAKSKLTAGTTLNYGCHIAVGTVEEVVAALAAYPVAGKAAVRMTPVYRFWKSPKSLYTTSFTEGAKSFSPGGFKGTAIMVFPDAAPGMIPLYRCKYGKTNSFISLSGTCEGQVVIGRVGYVYGGQRTGTIPIYRFFNRTSGDHLVTTNYAEGEQSGYAYEGKLGFTVQ